MKKKHSKYLWSEIISYIEQARKILDQANGSVEHIDDSQLKEFLECNELELALDELESISDNFELPQAFWQLMLKAANRMELKRHSKRYMKFISLY